LARDPATRETLRAVRLRRAAILEQRLGRLDAACEELERVVRDFPEHVSALRWLADLYERAGEPARALALLDALLELATDRAEREVLSVRRVRCLVAAGD